MSSETELKLWLHPADIEAFRTLPRLRRARAREERLRTIYFDTPDFKLARHGIALRVRRSGGGWMQTLKTEGQRSGGLSQRLELETPVPRPRPDFLRLPSEMVDKLVRRKWRTALVPQYETRFLRTAWNLRTSDGSRVEVALDVGVILAGKKSRGLCEVELELELKSGSVEALYALAESFASHVPLIPFDASKAERGARLAAGLADMPVGATPPSLEPDLPLCAGFARIARACLAQLQANLPGLLLADDPEYLHQARVAIRRLRSAVGLFRQACQPPAEEMARIAGLARALGAARDWDVFVLDTLPGLLESMPAGQGTLLLRRARAARRKARAAALALVSSPRTGADLLSLHRWLRGLEAVQGKPRLFTFARTKLDRLHQGVLAASIGFAEQAPEQRHALRIRVKRLRYALDTLGSLFGGHKKFAACFAALQDELGMLNDANTALGFLGQLNHDGRLEGPVRQFGRILGESMQGRIEGVDKMLRAFSGLTPSWH